MENIRKMINTNGYNKSHGKLVDLPREDLSPQHANVTTGESNTRRLHFISAKKISNPSKGVPVKSTGKLETIPRDLQDSVNLDVEGYIGKPLNQSLATNNSCILVDENG